MFRRLNFRRWISVPRQSRNSFFRSTCKTPELAPGFFVSRRISAARSALRVARHEAVVADFGDLEPLVAIVREGRQGVVDLLEIWVGGSDFAVQLLRRLEGRFHDR